MEGQTDRQVHRVDSSPEKTWTLLLCCVCALTLLDALSPLFTRVPGSGRASRLQKVMKWSLLSLFERGRNGEPWTRPHTVSPGAIGVKAFPVAIPTQPNSPTGAVPPCHYSIRRSPMTGLQKSGIDPASAPNGLFKISWTLAFCPAVAVFLI